MHTLREWRRRKKCTQGEICSSSGAPVTCFSSAWRGQWGNTNTHPSHTRGAKSLTSCVCYKLHWPHTWHFEHRSGLVFQKACWCRSRNFLSKKCTNHLKSSCQFQDICIFRIIIVIFLTPSFSELPPSWKRWHLKFASIDVVTEAMRLTSDWWKLPV